MPVPALLAHKALLLRRERRRSRPPTVGPYSRIHLDMQQTGSTMSVEALTGPSLHLHEVFVLIADEWIRLGSWQSEQTTVLGEAAVRHRTSFDLDIVAPEVLPDPGDPDEEPEQGAKTSVWISVTEDRERPPRYATEVVQEDEVLSYRVPLGRFQRTAEPVFAPLTNSAGQSVLPYVNRNGHLALVIDQEISPNLRVEVSHLRIEDGRLVLAGALASRHTVLTGAELQLVGRDGAFQSSSPARITTDPMRSVRTFGGHFYEFSTEHDFLRDLVDGIGKDTIGDLWIQATTTDGQVVRGRVGRTPYLVRKGTNDGWVASGDTTLAITPYFTFKAKFPSLHLELFPTDAHKRLRGLMRPGSLSLHRLRPGSKPVWLLGERPYKAQDNGLHLFRHLRTHHPEIDAYYVIEEDSPERANLEGLDHVLDFKSLEHIETCLRADRLVGTHHPNFLYPARTPRFARKMKAPKVFLQHGVMGTKWMALNYGKRVTSFETDLFLVSSEREKEYIVQDFGYQPDEVAVTGLARFDTLFDGSIAPVKGQILVLPTWRDWLQDPDAFTQTEYFEQWHGLLTDPRLSALLARHDASIVFCLHPNMQQFSHHFHAPGVTVVHQGDVDVQDLLKQSEVMITDYSSPGFDFSFLDKPVIYFQFDVMRFLGRWGSHLDLGNELPGPIAHDRDRALDLLDDTLARGGTIEPRYAARAARFLTHRDRDNSERIIDAVRGARRDRSFVGAVTGAELPQLVLQRARRSQQYFPVMRRLFALARLLPAREAILFESGIGRQYSDSPRYIYEELVRREDPRHKVWVYDKSIPVWEPNLTVVKRLSPAYFWHLGRSRYWVNNQNFPHYIRRRRDGVYLQTWHGTPLKRMLHDLDEVVGRDEGYVDRVTNAVAQWTTLLSPSPYATQAFRSAFQYDGDVLEVGYPRNDILCAPDSSTLVEQVMQRLQLPEGKRIVLYAPTFRDDSKGRRGFSFELPFDLERFAQEMGDDVVLLLRMHVLIADKLVVPKHLRHRVVDVSKYPDIQELYLISDVLVTDYSSVFFDFALLERPMVFHAYDLDKYRDQLRGFYLDYPSEVPGPITTTEDELYTALRTSLAPGGTDRSLIDAFIARFAPHDDGHAAARVVDSVLAPPEAHDQG
ncbi:CDP-glycerol glycerophosphotransferase family protein [Janibacter limosus]|uniref:CDP-glycerol glycerophosphotransferase family protein n=1 Tax=Janibacter limosus TaxID=53458 RepID=UPI000A8BE1F9|nr:CDP-glycerol glycerophosphotransferase family protein [Janibacter limosus]